jgi:superfamily II DNA or RNA helicase
MVEQPAQQIMILAHNKNLLKYLHDAIEHRGIATVGYYVGGMKEAALKATESKQIVIATYAMASEALDIRTLTTLIMATPKTSIEQSVGRILREKHSRPLVVDVVDSHQVFRNQWNKRRAFYKKQGYTIVSATGRDALVGRWQTVYTPGGAAAKAGGRACTKSSTEEEEEDFDEEEEEEEGTANPKVKGHRMDGGDVCLLRFTA